MPEMSRIESESEGWEVTDDPELGERIQELVRAYNGARG